MNETTFVDATPVKAFFVDMLTRDISLADSILDLLDNCVDGVLRSKKSSKTLKPYKGYYADIIFNKSGFSIKDNCGGIPWKLHKYAFRMGRSKERPKEVDGSVGVYGIGMKRAIFKMGESCKLTTQNKDRRYVVKITPDWLTGPSWDLPVHRKKVKDERDGTTISIKKLRPGVSKQFSDTDSFEKEMHKLVSTHYAFIIAKGFKVTLNGEPVIARPTKLIFDEANGTSVKPYIFEGEIDGVEVFLTVGFTRPIPSKDEINDEQSGPKYSTQDAGWTVVCNDRAVLYCNRDELTGWGEAGIARYHTQFIAISGIVEFKSKDPRKLPTTTTKRGIDASSSVYLQVKNRMRDGMGLFINYTNKWKGLAEVSKKHIDNASPLTLSEIKDKTSNLKMATASSGSIKGEFYKPQLPMPKKLSKDTKRISFEKPIKEIRCIGEYYFDDSDTSANEIGKYCFEELLKDAK